MLILRIINKNDIFTESICVLQPRQVKRSSSFFGALSGQLSRSPTKFFRKPTPSGHLSRTTTPASHTPTNHNPLTKTPSFGGLRGGSIGGGGRGAEGVNRPGTRGQQGVTGGGGGGGESVNRPGTRGLGVTGAGARNAGVGPGGPQRAPPTTAVPLSRRALQGGQDQQRVSGRMPVFSSATSWRQRPLELFDDLLDDSKSQSAPSSSNAPGRKRVVFADQRSSSGVGHSRPSKPSLAAAVAAAPVHAPPTASEKTAFLSTNSGVNGGTSSGGPSRDSHDAPAPGNVDRSQGDGHAPNGGPTRPVPVVSAAGNSSSSSSRDAAKKSAPTLSYRTLGKDIVGKTSSQPPASKSGGLGTLLPGGRQTTLNSSMGQGRSRTQLLVSGSGGGGRKTHFD